MIKVCNVTKSFDKRMVLKNVSFSLENRSLTGIVGPSGSGKSVLLKVLAGVLQADSGKVEIVHGVETDQTDEPVLSVGFLFQEGALFDSVSVLENVAFPLCVPDRLGWVSRQQIHRAHSAAFQALKSVGLERHVGKHPGQLSGGMRRRVAIARAVVAKPDLVLLDDPTGGLDPVTSNRILALIRKLHEEYQTTIVIVSHDIRRLLPSVRRVVALFDGQVLCDLPTCEIGSRADSRVVEFLARRYDFSAGCAIE